MPIMNGLEATERIVRASSIPVLIFTHNMDPELPFKALELGAADFLLKPDFNDLNKPEYVGNFIARLQALSRKAPTASLRIVEAAKRPRDDTDPPPSYPPAFRARP